MLVTGGAGFIGSHLVDALLDKGASVVVLDDLSTGKAENLTQHQRLELVVGTVEDAGLVARCANGCTHIAHLAAVVSVQDSIADPVRSHAVNLTSTMTLLEAVRREGAKIVFASSAAVYGDNGKAEQREGEESAPLSPYGVQKLASEHYVRCYSRLYGVRGVSFRQFNVYGPRQDPSSPYSGVISIFAKRALNNEDLFINGDGLQTRDFIYVSDVVACYLRALGEAHMTGQAVNVGTGEKTSIRSLAESLLETVGGSTSSIHHRDAVPGDIRYSCADTADAQASGFLGKTFVGLEEGLKKTIEWYRS